MCFSLAPRPFSPCHPALIGFSTLALLLLLPRSFSSVKLFVFCLLFNLPWKTKWKAMLLKPKDGLKNVPINNFSLTLSLSRSISLWLGKSADTTDETHAHREIHVARHFAEFKATLLVFKYNHNGKLSILVFIYISATFPNWNLTCSSVSIGWCAVFFSVGSCLLPLYCDCAILLSACISCSIWLGVFHLNAFLKLWCRWRPQRATLNSRRCHDFTHASNCDRKRLI